MVIYMYITKGIDHDLKRILTIALLQVIILFLSLLLMKNQYHQFYYYLLDDGSSLSSPSIETNVAKTNIAHYVLILLQMLLIMYWQVIQMLNE